LSQQKLKGLLESWRQEYPYILIDTPPILVVADAAALASTVDGVVFVLRAGRTHGEAALAGKQRLVDVGAKLVGGILNGARLELERGYRYYYYYREGKRTHRDRPAPAPVTKTG
jgi:Mrp family chromosome partitioning ATPase